MLYLASQIRTNLRNEMCNGFSTRISEGGTIAVLNPPILHGPSPSICGNLKFIPDETSLGTRAIFEAQNGCDKIVLGGRMVVIQ